jgi:ParB family chromosome partitioning protein
MKKKPLGRGLEALIPKSDSKKNIVELDINDIIPNANQPRQFFDEEGLTELAQSIKEHGIIQPILVKKENDKYKIIAGERRFRAAQQIKLERVPAIIKDVVHENQALEIGLIENIQREDLNAVDLAMAYNQLIEKFQYSQEALSKVVGKSRSAIANTLRLLNLPREILNAVSVNVITEGHARALLSLENNKTISYVFNRIVERTMSVRETENLVKKLKKGQTIKSEVKSPFSPFKEELEREFENYFDTNVKISGKFSGGTIRIIYKSKENLEKIINKIRGELC